MKTAEEKAISWLSDNIGGFDERVDGDDVISLALLLKMQSRETWEACLEAIVHCDKEGKEFEAIMNVTAV